jgi:hypothetical protein
MWYFKRGLRVATWFDGVLRTFPVCLSEGYHHLPKVDYMRDKNSTEFESLSTESNARIKSILAENQARMEYTQAEDPQVI